MFSTIFHGLDWQRATKFNGKDVRKWALSYTAGEEFTAMTSLEGNWQYLPNADIL